MAFNDHGITRKIVLDCFNKKERLTCREIMAETSLSRPVVAYHLKTLFKDKVIVKSTIYGFWELS